MTSLMDNLQLLLWSLLLASSFVFSAQITEQASAIMNTWLRFVIAALAIMPFLRHTLSGRKLSAYIHWRMLLSYIAATACLMGFFMGFFISLQYTSAFNTAVIYSFLPLLTLVSSAVLIKAKFDWHKVPGFVLGSIGAVMVLFFTRTEVLPLALNLGDAIFLVATALLALHVVLAQKVGQGVPLLLSTFLILTIGSGLLTPIILWRDEQLPTLGATEYWMMLGWLAIFTTLMTIVLQQRLVQRVGASHFIAYSYLIPVLVAIMEGALHLGNLVQSLPGVGLVLLGLVWISRVKDASSHFSPEKPDSRQFV